MAEAMPVREHPLAAVATSARSGQGVEVKPLPASDRLVFRGDPAAAAAVAPVLRLTLPMVACRAAVEGTRAALWLGPDEWLLLVPAGEAARLHEGLAKALGALPASVVDVSHRQTALGVSGPRAADVLGGFVALDLDLPHFPVGMCTRTLLGKAEVVLWRTADETFRLEVARSFAAYVCGCLAEAMREHAG